jgi:hypothetical protein
MSDRVSDHKEFVGRFVERTPSAQADAVLKEGLFSNAKAKRHLNAFVAKLSSKDRKMLAEMLRDERRSAFHDALVILNEALDLDGFSLNREGKDIRREAFGLTLFQEYIMALDDPQGWAAIE